MKLPIPYRFNAASETTSTPYQGILFAIILACSFTLAGLTLTGVLFESWKLTLSLAGSAVFVLILAFRLRVGLYLLILFVPLLSSLQLRADIVRSYLLPKLDLFFYYSPYHVVAVVAFGIWAFKALAKPHERSSGATGGRDIIDVSLATLMCWAAITLLWAPDVLFGIRHLFQLFLNAGLFYFAIAMISSESAARRAAVSWLLIGVIMSIAAVADRYYVLHHQIDKLTRIDYANIRIFDWLKFVVEFRLLPFRASGLSSFDVSSLIINASMPLTLFVMARKSVLVKVTGFLCLILMVVGRTFILNKSGLGSFLAMSAFILLFYRPFQGRRLMLIVLFALILAGSLWFTQYNTFKKISGANRVASSSSGDKNSLSIRMKWWKQASGYVIEKAGAGLGPGGLRITVNAPHSHSLIFSFFFEYGVIGLVCGLLFVGGVLRRHCRIVAAQETEMQRLSFLLLAGMVALLIQMLVDLDLIFAEPWLFFGTAVAVTIVAKKTAAPLSGINAASAA